MACRQITGLTHLWCQSEVAAELLRRGEARHIADRRQHRECDDRAYPRNGHQTPGSRIVKSLPRQHFVELCHLCGYTLKLNDQATQHGTFLVGQGQTVEPLAARLAEEMPAVFRDQVRVQDRLDASLQSDYLFKDAHPLGNLASTAQCILVGDPHLGEKACRVQPGQDCRIDLVCLDPGVGDGPDQTRVRHRDASHMRAHQPLDRGAVAGRLDDDLVFQAERPGEVHQGPVNKVDPQFSDDLPILQDRHLSKRPMDVHADDTHAVPPAVRGSKRACTTSTDPRSQRSRASRRGRPRNNSSSQLMVRSACRRFVLPTPLSRQPTDTSLPLHVPPGSGATEQHAPLTMLPSAPSEASRSAASHGCSPAPTAAEKELRRCIR